MAEKLLKIIKSFVIPLSLIFLVMLAIYLNKLLIDYSNSENNVISEEIIIESETQENIQGSLISSIGSENETKIPETQIISNVKKISENKGEIYEFFNADNDNAPSKLGANIHWAARENPDKDMLINEIVDEGNIKYAREEFNWELIEPIQGKRDYSRYDEIISNYQHYDVKILGLLSYSTSWSAQAPKTADNKEFYPPDILQWNDFVAETVSRYQGKVEAWEIWNEPNDPNFFNGSQAEYFNLLKNSYRTIKSIDPHAQVISGGTTWPDSEYANNFYNAGMNNFIDGYGLHSYYCEQGIQDSHYEKLAADLVPIIKISKQYQKKVWITEFSCSSFEIGQKKQADNLAYMMSLFNSSADIERVYWYSLRDTENPGKEGGYGLITKDFTLKQAFQAFQYFNP